MTKTTRTKTAGLVAALAGMLLCALPAQAQTRVFVSGTGSDSNPCTVAMPCRSFAQAIMTVAAGGEIDVLDPAGYGTVTISHAISIQGHGFAGISVPSGGTGITINAGSGDAINLAGLLIDGANVGAYGIVFNSGKSLTVEDCIIRYSGTGIDFQPSSAAALAVTNTVVADNAADGIVVATASSSTGAVTGAIDRVNLYNNGTIGLFVQSNSSSASAQITVTAKDTVASNNGAALNGDFGGFESNSCSDCALARLTLKHSVAANNSNYGVLADANTGSNAQVIVNDSAVTDNAKGWGVIQGGVIYSTGNNVVNGNAADQGAQTTLNPE